MSKARGFRSLTDEVTAAGPILAFLGAGSLDEKAANLVTALGRFLAKETNLRIATSGYRGNPEASGSYSAAYTLIQAALGALGEAEAQHRILTYQVRNSDLRRQFSAGAKVRPTGRSFDARRLSIISQSDVICLIGGEKGTKTLFDFALAVEKPVLPLPFGGGAAKHAWLKHKSLIAREFGLSSETISHWSTLELKACSSLATELIASEIGAAILRGIRRRCSIMMPFSDDFDWVYEQIILPAVQLAHFEAIRTDRLSITGDITEYLRSQIDSCQCGIAVITHANPNVLYELGVAHALGKPVLLLKDQSEGLMTEPIPFDIQNHRVFPYMNKMNERELSRCVSEICRTIRRATSQ